MASDSGEALRAILRGPAAFLAGDRQEDVILQGGWGGRDPALPGQRLFLEVVSTNFPEVLQTLRSDVLPVYQPAIAHERRLRIDGIHEPYSRDKQACWQELAADLERWGARWHLVDGWVFLAALWTLHAWDYEAQEGIVSPPGWWLATTVYSTSSEETAVFEIPPWSVGLKSKDEAKAEITTALERERDRYLEKLEKLAKPRGYREPEPSRARPGKGEKGGRNRHYEWLARWQVGREPQAYLAKQAGVAIRTVARALRKTAQEIGLKRRSEGTGSP